MDNTGQQPEGIEICGRFFTFVTITPHSQQAILKKRYGQVVRRMLHSLFFPSRQLIRYVKKFRSYAFVKDSFLWKYLHIVPKQLRIKNIKSEVFKEANDNFLAHYRARAIESNGLYNSQHDSKSKNQSKNS